MEGAADKLETLFRKAESDLEYMTRRLDDEFGERLQNDQQLNPGELTQRLQQVKKEYANIVKDANEIKALQAEMCESFKSQLQATCTALQHLNTVTPENATESSEGSSTTQQQQELVESLLNISLPKSSNDTADTQGACASGDSTVDSNSQVDHEQDQQAEECKKNSLPIQATSPAELRANSTECVDLTEDEFNSVSTLVRGRVALADVNKVYHVLFRFFKEEGNKVMLTIQEMSKMGLRITGTTGEAKLKVLRSLKLLQISKIGSVKLL